MNQLTVERITEFNSELIDELSQIETEAFDDGALNRWTFPVLIRHGAVFVLKCDDKICGVADVIKDWIDPKLAFIVGFAVRKGERGKGLGYKLLSQMIDKLRDDGIRKIQLTVDPKNERAINFYRKVGFRQITEFINEYGLSTDRFLFELELEDR